MLTLRLILLLAVGAIVLLGTRLLFGDIGVLERERLAARVSDQQARTAALAERNAVLANEVAGLQHTLLAVEARARTELGMVREGETFYLVHDDR
ncbi:MAG: septum formation initiator family protein [Pseudomonadota bacterium]